MNFEVGDTIGAYRLVTECGQGAYGAVFLAESTVTRRRLALKVVYRLGRNSERELRGLERYQLICPRTGLLQIYHVEDCGEYFYYTMDAADDLSGGGEYVPDTLANRLSASGRLSAEAVRKMADELVECLNALHGKGLLHRDIKPDNILWIDGTAKLGDIGLVTAGGTTVLAGTPGFMPPEVLAGTRECERKDDFYALGKVIYCALTGNPVEKFPSFPDDRTLGDCGDLVVLYNRLCRGDADAASPVFGRPRRRAPRIAVAAAVVAVCLIAAVWFALRPNAETAAKSAGASGTSGSPDSATVVWKRVPAPQRTTVSQKPKPVSSSGNYDVGKLDFIRKLPSWFTTRTTWYKRSPCYLGLEELPEVAEAKNASAFDRRAARLRELDALLKEYAVSPEFLDIFPQVIDAVLRMELECMSIKREFGFDKAQEFRNRHIHDPEVQFEADMCLVSYWTDDALKNIENEVLFMDYVEDLKKVLIRRKKSEAALLEKYGSGRGASVPQKSEIAASPL